MKIAKKLLSVIVCALIVVGSFSLPMSVFAEAVSEVSAVESLIASLGEAELTDEFADKLEAAESAYAALSDTQKQQVSNYSALTDARWDYDFLRYEQAGWYYPKTFDFDDQSKTQVTDYATLSEGTNNLSNSSIDNKTLKVESNGGSGTLMFDVYSNIETYSVDVKMDSATTMHLSYYNNPETGDYSALMICNDGAKVSINPVRYSDNHYVNIKTVSWEKSLTEGKWFTVKLTYGTEYATGKYDQHYSPGTVKSKHITNITVTDTATGDVIGSADISAANHVRAYAYGVDRNIAGNESAEEPQKAQIGFRAYGKAAAYFDNLTVTYRNKENAQSYKIRYEDILSKNAEDISEADKPRCDEAFNTFMDLDDSQKMLLTNEISTLVSFAKVLYPADYTKARQYISKYSQLLGKSKYDASDFEDLKKAYDDFNNLNSLVQKLVYCPYKINLDSALKYISDNPAARAENNIDPLKFDFEYFQNPLVLESKPTEEYKGGIVVDPTDSSNHVFAMQGTNLFYLIRDEYLPSVNGLQVSHFSLRFYTEAVDNGTSPLFSYAFEDTESFHAMTFESHPNSNAMPFRHASMNEGQFSEKQLLTYSSIEFGKWAELSFDFVETACSVSLKVGDDIVSYYVDYILGAQIALGFFAEYGHASEMVYIDDISLKFDIRDYDTNQKNYNINVYYQGNTFQKPDDTVLLNGASLYKNVQDAQLYVIEDKGVDVTNPQYIFEMSYDSSKVDDGIKSTPVEPSWDSNNASIIDFVQKTGSSLKFILPKSEENHIYAVKLNPTYLGVKSKILYLNNPELDFVMGNDGDDATQGGTLRIIGKNLYIDNKHQVNVVLKSLDNNTTVHLTDLEVIEGDNYSIKVNLPKDLATGQYEVYVHNGYGDNTCWSEPIVCSVKERAENEIWSSNGYYDVTDYGAVGDVDTNDTPAIIAALDAASRNGGGTVYFPRGQYRVISTLAIPRNVTIEGESKGNTMIFWDAHHWDYEEVPPLVTITGNVEFKNIYLYATRNSQAIAMQCDVPIREYEYLFGTNKYICLKCGYTYNGDVAPNKCPVLDCGATAAEFEQQFLHDNVYIENVDFWGAFEAGNPSVGGMAWKQTEELTAAEMVAITTKEAGAHKVELNAGGKNYQVSNFSCEISKYPGYFQALMINGYYINVNNTKLPYVSFSGIGRKVLAEDNDFRGRSVGINGSDMYLARNKFGYVEDNNREGYVSDGVPRYIEERVQLIESDPNKLTFKDVSRSRFELNQFAGMEIYVVSGQGVGQCRTIVSSKIDGTFVINEPFEISPNRNSVVTIFEPRANIKFVQNSFEECSTNGPFGVHVDGIWDGNVYSRSQGQYFCPNRVFEWYITLANQVFKDPLYIQGEGVGPQYGGTMTDNQIFIWTNTAPRPYSFVGMTIRENDLDGHNIHIKSSITNCINDIIIENNRIMNVKQGIYIENNVEVLDGLYIRNNEFDTSEFDIDPKLVSNSINHCKYKRCIIVNAGESIIILGDVNLDGKVTLKDCTYITYYYMDMIDLSEEQKKRADVNSDNEYDLKDATRIKQHILYGVVLGKISSDDGTYPGYW